MPAWRAIGSVLVAAAMLGPAGARPGARPSGQLIPGPVKELSTGKILIAQRDLADPNFTKTVVLIVELNTEGTVGLILNRRSDVMLASVFEKMKPREGSAPVFYLGGPVQIDGVIGLLRADQALKDTHHVFGDVYVTSGRETLEDMVAAGADPSRFRAYLGYAGWSPGQLERETAQGSWRVLKSVAGTVFDPNPDSLWDRLINETDGLSACLRSTEWHYAGPNLSRKYVGPNFSWAGSRGRSRSRRPLPGGKPEGQVRGAPSHDAREHEDDRQDLEEQG